MYIDEIMNEIAEQFSTDVPRYYLNADLPPNILGMYDPKTETIYFAGSNPDPVTVAHEMIHHVDTSYRLTHSVKDAETLAYSMEKWYQQHMYAREGTNTLPVAAGAIMTGLALIVLLK